MTSPAVTEAPRARFHGVGQILRFNTRFYLAGVLVPCAVFAAPSVISLPPVLQWAMLAGASMALFWTIASLAVSYYVYDVARVTDWTWIPASLSKRPRRWVNIHSGLDESTEALRRQFPAEAYKVLDIYDPKEMTEPSIAVAREANHAWKSATPAKFDALPLQDGAWDTVFLLFAAHEIRHHHGRVALLREVHRILEEQGQVLIVEHLRDASNFVAFGPGFLHFHSRNAWLQAMNEAGLRVQREWRLTPFVKCFWALKPKPESSRAASVAN